MKKHLILVILICFLVGCGGQSVPGETTVATMPPVEHPVGICLPDEANPYWAACGALLQEELAAIGYETTISYCNNDAQVQAQQVEELYSKNVSCLILGAIDSVGLEKVLADYQTAGIPVVALDRMVMDAACVEVCISFDYRAIGETMGRYVETELALATAAQTGRSHTVEFLMGSPDDPNALAIHQGLIGVLQPYLSSGVLTCPSGRTSFEDTWVLREDSEKAGENLTRYIQRHYEENTYPQIVFASSDLLAQGCIQALQALECPVTQWPIITGQGWQTQDVTQQRQAMTVQKNTRQLVTDCVGAVQMLLTYGQLSQDFAQSTADNHARSVPMRYCGFEMIAHSQEQTESEEMQEPLQ